MTPEEAAAAAREALKQEFGNATRMGTKLLKANSFKRAAKEFGRAIEIAEELDMPPSTLETLYNNRAAMYEKADMLDASLEDCTVVLAMNAAHIKVRKRRARIYQAQGRVQDSLVEYCAVLVADTVDMKKKLEPFKDHPELMAQQQQAMMNKKGAEQAVVQEKLQELMTLCGKAKADEVIKARELDPSLLSNTGITSESSVFQLLLSYSDYLDQEAASSAADLSELTEAVKSANSAEDSRAKMNSLRNRAMHYMAVRKYEAASEDLMALYSLLKTEYPQLESGEDIETSDTTAEDSGLLRWVALFHHVKYDLEGAFTVYEQASKLALGNDAASCAVEVMKSGVLVDKGDVEGADAVMAKAFELDPESVDVLMHRSQLSLLKGESDKAEEDLRLCLEKSPQHVVA